jgi:hypothetical protein
MGIGISIFSYAGTVTVGIIVDAGLVPDPDALVADLHVEYLALRAKLSAGASPQLDAEAASARAARVGGSL